MSRVGQKCVCFGFIPFFPLPIFSILVLVPPQSELSTVTMSTVFKLSPFGLHEQSSCVSTLYHFHSFCKVFIIFITGESSPCTRHHLLAIPRTYLRFTPQRSHFARCHAFKRAVVANSSQCTNQCTDCRLPSCLTRDSRQPVRTSSGTPVT